MNLEEDRYFRFKCISDKSNKIFIIISSILLSISGVIYWGFAGLAQQMNSYYHDTIIPLMLTSSNESLFNSITAYFIIAGVIQFLSGGFFILIESQWIGKINQGGWFKAIIIILALNIGLSFAVGVFTSITSLYYSKVQSFAFNNIGIWVEINSGWDRFISFSKAEATLSFLLTIPLTFAMIISLSPQKKKDEVRGLNAEKQPSRGNIQH